MNETMLTPTTDDEEMRTFILQAFDYAIENNLNADTRNEALYLTRLYLNNSTVSNATPLFGTIIGFMLGIEEGMRIADVLNNKKTATPTDESKDCR